MLNKPGALDLIICVALFGIGLLAGESVPTALTLIAGLHAFIGAAALLVNIACLRPCQRQATLQVLATPYSAFIGRLVSALLMPATDHLQTTSHHKAGL